MIYAQVLGKPWYGLDQFLDFSDFPIFSQRVKFAIARNRHKLSYSFSGPSTPGLVTWLPDQDYIELADAREQVKQYFESDQAADWEKEEWEQLRADERFVFTMLTLPAKSLGFALSLRRLKSSHFQAGNGGGFAFKHYEKCTEDTALRPEFEFVMDWIKKQNVFAEIGRVQFFINGDGHGTPIHRDYANKSHSDEFIWINFFENKKFFIYDSDENVKHYITERSAIFDNHQWHGGDSSPGMGVSLRVDGMFSKKFIEKTDLNQYVKFNYYRK